MATTLATQGIAASLGWDYENVVALGNSIQTNSFKFSPSQYTNGTAAGNADRFYATSGTLTASSSFSITFTNYTDFFGNSLSMLRWKIMWLANLATTAGTTCSVGNGTNPLVNWISAGTATVLVRPGGLLYLHAGTDATGYAITASTADTLKILNNDGANPLAYQLSVTGCSA